MLPLGHLGLGYQIAARWKPEPLWIFFLGTLLPDLIDKPLYYGLSAYFGAHGADLGLISGTRTFGHILWVWVALLSFSRSRVLALGALTHLVLDHFLGVFLHLEKGNLDWSDFWVGSDRVAGLLFPLAGIRFPIFPFKDASSHLSDKFSFFVVGAEVLGAWVMARLWRRRHGAAGSAAIF